MADSQAREDARLRRVFHVKPPKPAALASPEELQRYYDELDQWEQDERNRPPEPVTPKKKPDVPLSPEKRGKVEVEVGPVVNPPGPIPETEIKFYLEIYENRRMYFLIYYGIDIDQELIPTGQSAGGSFIFR